MFLYWLERLLLRSWTMWWRAYTYDELHVWLVHLSNGGGIHTYSCVLKNTTLCRINGERHKYETTWFCLSHTLHSTSSPPPLLFIHSFCYSASCKEIWYFRGRRLTPCKSASSSDTVQDLTPCCVCVGVCLHVGGREGGERRRVTGANQKGSPGCRGEGISGVGDQRGKAITSPF